jgi:hypothetical protein
MPGKTGRREMVAACMESPLYFTLPLRKRLELMKQVEQPPGYCPLRQDVLAWIRTGILSPAAEIHPPTRPRRTP